jgi:hypothetical protein
VWGTVAEDNSGWHLLIHLFSIVPMPCFSKVVSAVMTAFTSTSVVLCNPCLTPMRSNGLCIANPPRYPNHVMGQNKSPVSWDNLFAVVVNGEA